jgi:hypothetical protein
MSLKIISIFLLSFSLHSTLKLYIPVGVATIANELKKNHSELAFGVGAEYEFFIKNNWGFSSGLALSTTNPLFTGNDDVFVKPVFYGLSPGMFATYKILGQRVAFLPSVGLKARFGIMHVTKKLLTAYASHNYFAYGLGPSVSMGYQIIDFIFSIGYSLEFGKPNLRQEMTLSLAYVLW